MSSSVRFVEMIYRCGLDVAAVLLKIALTDLVGDDRKLIYCFRAIARERVYTMTWTVTLPQELVRAIFVQWYFPYVLVELHEKKSRAHDAYCVTMLYKGGRAYTGIRTANGGRTWTAVSVSR